MYGDNAVDKYLCQVRGFPGKKERKDKSGQAAVNGETVKDRNARFVPVRSDHLPGEELSYEPFHYPCLQVLMVSPQKILRKTVIDLIEEPYRKVISNKTG